MLTHQTLCEPLINCDRKVNVQPGIYCWNIAKDNAISVDYLRSLNPGLNCDDLQPNQLLCVARSGTSGAARGEPSRLAVTDAQCQKSVSIKAADSCWSVASASGISLSELQGFNPPGINCDGLQIGQVICVNRVKVPSITATKTRNSVSVTKSRTKSPFCRTTSIKPGDSCWAICSANGITVSELQELNPPGIDCDALQVGQEVCIGIYVEVTSKSSTLIRVIASK